MKNNIIVPGSVELTSEVVKQYAAILYGSENELIKTVERFISEDKKIISIVVVQPIVDSMNDAPKGKWLVIYEKIDT